MSTHDLLAGRTIVVTGAATGIGQAFAVLLPVRTVSRIAVLSTAWMKASISSIS